MRRTIGSLGRSGIAVLCTATLLAAGCNQPAAGGRRATDAEGRPGDTVAGTGADDRYLFIAEQELVSRCMEAAGFRYVVTRPDVDVPDEPPQWGDDDVAALRRDGYDLQLGTTSIAASDPNAAIVQALPVAEQAAYTEALFGGGEHSVTVTYPDGRSVSTNSDGCYSEVRELLYGDLRTWLNLDFVMNNLETEVDALVVADPAYSDGLAEWSRCMEAQGFSYESPGAARDAISQAYAEAAQPEEQIRRREIETAVADGRCVAKSDLSTIAYDLEDRYRKQVRADREGDIAAFRELQAEAVTRARDELER